MSFELPPLPYPMDVLAPHISKETLFYHHDKHHAGYVNKLNALIKDTEFESMSLKQIIQTADGAIFNNAAQVFNHTFYWYSLWPQKTTPSHDLHEAIERDFGSMERFVEQFSEAAVGLFGSGWCWLTMDEERKLNIEATSNAHTPIEHEKIPLLTCDVWEHAYYIDYRNERARYVEQFWQLANWEHASKIYENGAIVWKYCA